VSFLRQRLLKWGRSNYANFPWRYTRNRWHALTAEVMLQRTRAEQVLPVYRSFVKRFSNADSILRQKPENLFSELGLVWRHKVFLKLARILTECGLPSTEQGLRRLPGVGDYIASALLSLHMGIRAPIIDSNVVRIYGRFFGFATDGETRRKKWLKDLADAVTPRRAFRDFNYALIDFTRDICRPKPRCTDCPLSTQCSYFTGKDARGRKRAVRRIPR